MKEERKERIFLRPSVQKMERYEMLLERNEFSPRSGYRTEETSCHATAGVLAVQKTPFGDVHAKLFYSFAAVRTFFPRSQPPQQLTTKLSTRETESNKKMPFLVLSPLVRTTTTTFVSFSFHLTFDDFSILRYVLGTSFTIGEKLHGFPRGRSRRRRGRRTQNGHQRRRHGRRRMNHAAAFGG